MFSHTLRIVVMACTAAWGVAHANNTTEYGYIRLDIYGLMTIGSACYAHNKRTGEWKHRTASDLNSVFRSCHGNYMRVQGHGGRLEARIRRDAGDGNPACGTDGLRFEVHKKGGHAGEGAFVWFKNKSGCGYVDVDHNKKDHDYGDE